MKRTIAALLAIGLFACNMNYEKTPSGLPYKIFSGNGSVKAKPGEFVKFNMMYKLADRDSVLQSTYGRIPAYATLDTGRQSKYTIMEVLPLMNVGDSAEVSMSIDTLKNRGMIQDYTPFLVKGQVLIAKVKLLQVFKDEKDMLADYDSSIVREREAETKSLEDYMAKNNLKGVKTKNGAYVVVESPGDVTNKADSGKLASVMYRGYLETTGKVFDTNMDTTKGHTDPYQVVVGNRGVVQGFNEGLPYFGKGGKGKILIPSLLGYGPQGSGADIPPFANLVFDIEVRDVQAAPQSEMNPMMMQQLQQQMQQQQQQKKDSTK